MNRRWLVHTGRKKMFFAPNVLAVAIGRYDERALLAVGSQRVT
jgi:hypothetical protein